MPRSILKGHDGRWEGLPVNRDLVPAFPFTACRKVYMLMGASHFWVAGGFTGTRSVILAFGRN